MKGWDWDEKNRKIVVWKVFDSGNASKCGHRRASDAKGGYG